MLLSKRKLKERKEFLMRKIILVVAAIGATLALSACNKAEPPATVQETPAADETLVPEQATRVGEAIGAIRDAGTIATAHEAYRKKTVDFTPTMLEPVDVVYDARFAEAVAAAKGDRTKIAALREYIITFKNRGCVVTSSCEVREKP